jgi:CheY-like chemotaxis protein/HPt (histidine-containing phosphotransfer) domain-containing protein
MVEPKRSLHILLAEDNEVNQMVATGMLRSWGHSVEVASNGFQVLSRMNLVSFDLILMDVSMPGMSGLEATSRIRELELGSDKHIPIIGVTAQVMPGDREMCLRAGMDAYVPKPIRKEILLEAIRRVGEGRASQDSEPGENHDDAGDVLDESSVALLRELESPGSFSIVNLIDLFKNGATDYLLAIKNAMTAGDSEETSRMAHALKGSCHSVGASRLARACLHLEAHSRSEDLAHLWPDFENLRAEFEIACVALEKAFHVEAPAVAGLESIVLDPLPLRDLRSLETLGDFSLSDALDLFFKDVTQRICAARKAIADQDIARWGREAHTLKSSASDFGARKLEGMSKDLEEMARKRQSDGALNLLDGITIALEEYKSALETYLLEGGFGIR